MQTQHKATVTIGEASTTGPAAHGHVTTMTVRDALASDDADVRRQVIIMIQQAHAEAVAHASVAFAQAVLDETVTITRSHVH